jgi:hypothetical protein
VIATSSRPTDRIGKPTKVERAQASGCRCSWE